MKYFVRLLSLCFFLVGGSDIVSSQVRTINIDQFGVNNSVLQDGKIKVTPSDTTFDLGLSIARPGFFDRPVKLEAIVVFDTQFGEYDASDTIKFTNADFVGSAGISNRKEGILATILGNNNIGSLKVKFRYYKDGYPFPDETDGWTSWLYHTKTYETIQDVDETEFIGPSKICDEGIIEIVNPGTITFENISGLVTKTDLPNNQYKLTRIGSANGVVTVKSVVGANTYTKNISIGGLVTPGIESMTNLQDNPTGDRFVVQEGSGNYKYSGTLKVANVSQVAGMSTSYSWSLVSGSTGAPFINWHASGNSVTVESKAGNRYVKLQCVITSGCASFTKEYTFYTGFGPL